MGNRQRLGLALALIHRPDLLILDEPGNALDPAGVVEVRPLLRRLADDEVTVLMSSHIIGEVAKLADRVGIIHAGHLLEELSSDRLGDSGRERLVSTFRSPEFARCGAEVLNAWGIDAQATRRRWRPRPLMWSAPRRGGHSSGRGRSPANISRYRAGGSRTALPATHRQG